MTDQPLGALASITESESDGVVKLTRTWRYGEKRLGILTVLGGAWFGVAAFAVVSLPWSLPEGLMPLFFFLSCLLVGYAVGGAWLNRSEYRVTTTRVTAWSGPLPYFGHNRDVERASVRELFVTEAKDCYGKASATFMLQARDGEGRVRTIAPGLQCAAEALYLRQRISELLGLNPEIR